MASRDPDVQRKREEDRRLAREGGIIVYSLFVILFAAAITAWSYLKSEGEFGQFMKFLVHLVVLNNFLGLLCFGVVLTAIILVVVRVITKRASQPVKAVLILVPFTVLFGGMGWVLASSLPDNIKDIISYQTGQIVEEQVTIVDLQVYLGRRGADTSYEYTFADGRKFYENHEGDGFGLIELGESYVIRYLPHTPKLLSIRKVE